MSKLTEIFAKASAAVNGKRLPYTYKVGEKSTSKGLPFDVKLTLDPDFKKTVLKTAGIISVGLIGLGIGIAVSKKK